MTTFAPKWRDDPMRWEVTSGTVFNILDNVSKDTSYVDRENGLFPSELITHLRRIADKYEKVDNHDIALDASLILNTVPSVMGLVSVLASAKKLGDGKSMIERGSLMYGSDGRIKLTDYGRDELARIYAEFSKQVGLSIDRKHVDMNEPILRWSPAKGWGVTKEQNAALPPRREARSRLTYRQWLSMIYTESRVYVAAQEDLIGQPVHLPDSPEFKLQEQNLKARHNQIKNVRKFAKLVLSGGPDSVWIGKPLVPKDVHNDVESFYASSRPGFDSKMVEASSMAWELWETDRVSLSDYAVIKDWLEIKKLENVKFRESESSVIEVDDNDRPVAYRKLSNADETRSELALQKYDPLGVNQPMTFAFGRAAEQIVDPGRFGHIDSSGGVVHNRCDYVYGADTDNKDPGHVPYTRKSGARCPNISVAGTTRCEMHGGMMASPAETRSMIIAAQMQAFALSGQALQTIADVMINGQTESARLRAAETILNRSGIVEGAEVDIRDSRKEADADSVSARDIVMDRLKKLSQYEEADRSREKQATIEMEGNVIDADVVETTTETA